LPRVGGALSARSAQYQGTAVSLSTAANGSVTMRRSVTTRSRPRGGLFLVRDDLDLMEPAIGMPQRVVAAVPNTRNFLWHTTLTKPP